MTLLCTAIEIIGSVATVLHGTCSEPPRYVPPPPAYSPIDTAHSDPWNEGCAAARADSHEGAPPAGPLGADDWSLGYAECYEGAPPQTVTTVPPAVAEVPAPTFTICIDPSTSETSENCEDQ